MRNRRPTRRRTFYSTGRTIVQKNRSARMAWRLVLRKKCKPLKPPLFQQECRKKEKDPIFKAILECAREKFWPVVPFVQDRYLTWGGAACRQVCKHCGYGEDKDEKVKKRFWEEKARPLLKEAMAQLRNGAVQRSKESFKAYYSSK